MGGVNPPGWCCCCEGVNPPRLDAVVLLRPLVTFSHWAYPWYQGAKLPWCHGVEKREISTRMLRGRFWLENQDFGVSFGAICIIFRATSFPTSPGSQNRLFRKIAPGVQGRRHGRGKKLFTLPGTKFEEGGQKCCEADFGTRIKILRYPLGRSASFFEIYLFRLVLAPKIDFLKNPVPEMPGAAGGGLTPPA